MIMIWICIIIHIIGAITTGILCYVGMVRQYVREHSHVKFSHWVESNDYYEKIFVAALFWFVVLPVLIIITPIQKIIEKINKHYNID